MTGHGNSGKHFKEFKIMDSDKYVADVVWCHIKK